MERRREERVSAKIAVIVRGFDSVGKSFSVPAEAADVSPSGTRLRGIHVKLDAGAQIEIERGGCKAQYSIEWVGADNTLQHGQLGARCLEAAGHPISMSASATAAAQKPPTDRERRRFSRKTCRIEVQVATQDESIRLPATITDLSLDGCYIEMLAPLPSGTLLHLSLKLERQEVRATGKVRYAQGGLGMGVEFLAISPEDFEQLRTFASPRNRASGSAASSSPQKAASLAPAGHTSSAIAIAPNPPAESHLPSTEDALEVIVRVLSRKGVLTRDELSAELERLKTIKT